MLQRDQEGGWLEGDGGEWMAAGWPTKGQMVMVWMAALWLLRAQPGISTQDLKPASRIYCREKGLPGGWAGNYPALDGRIIDSTNLPFCPPRELGATFLEQDCWEPWKKTGVTHGSLNIMDTALEAQFSRVAQVS